MFCILYEDKNYLLSLWEEILAGEHIYPFDELNLGLIEYYDGSDFSELPLLFIDDEFGLCGSVILRPLESNKIFQAHLGPSKTDLSAWLLEDIRMHIKENDAEFIYSSRIKALQMRFYKAFKEACYQIMEATHINKIMVASKDEKSHKFFKSYGDINFTKEYFNKAGVIGVIEKHPVVVPIKGNVLPFKLYG